MVRLPSKKQQGFTLIELLIALATGSIVLMGLSNLYISQSNLYMLRQQVSDMQQNARIGMDKMIRDIRMTGYDPTGNAGAGVSLGEPTKIQVTFDLNEDGDVKDENEDITYSLNPSGGDGHLTLDRSVAPGKMKPIADNIESLAFSYTLADGSTTDNPSDADLSQIRQVKIVLTSQTVWPDSDYPDNGGYRTYTLQSLINLRNLAY